MTGGELAAQVVIDCIARLLPGVLGNDQSAKFESFENNLLNTPLYLSQSVMDIACQVLLSGNHQEIQKWREMQSSC